jgi:uncharacterized repeat protein (TIGR03803 family)
MGTVFSIDTSGALTTLHSFSGGDGETPHARLVEGSDGAFYGTTLYGGASGTNNFGTVFRVDTSGAFTTLHSFMGLDGARPFAGLVRGDDGAFYGTTWMGGQGSGTVFRIDPAGSFAALHSFSGGSDGWGPFAGLVRGSDGGFYGPTWAGGTNNLGTVFRIDSSGTLTTLHSFSSGEGYRPYCALIQGADGKFYGPTRFGGASNLGTIYRVDSSGALTVLHSFAVGEARGIGEYASGGLVQASDGSFYGTTEGGGSNKAGTVFRVDASGALTTLHSFTGGDGRSPQAALVEGTDHKFYGTTYSGGTSDAGTVFRIDTAGLFTTLYSFTGDGDGGFPAASLIQGTDGSFYGTTVGTADFDYPSGQGTVFRINSSGALVTLYTFTGGTDGAFPEAPLLPGSDGSYYGTTLAGGANNLGTVFRIGLDGSLTTLHSFGGSEGMGPAGGLALSKDGKYYGTTSQGGAYNLGTVFRIDPSGSLTTVHSFAGPDGATPLAGLIQGSDGSLYGTTSQGGTNTHGPPPLVHSNLGTIFRIDASGVLTSLHSFDGGTNDVADGATPLAGLVQGRDGAYYGTTRAGGWNTGILFRVRPSIPLNLSASTITENDSVTLAGSFADSNAGYSHTVTINWGDGSLPTTLSLDVCIYFFTASHRYLDDNPTGTASDAYAISVIVTDNVGSSKSGSADITVNNAPPVISSLTGPSAPTAIGGSVGLAAAFTDVGSLDTQVCTFSWDDGSANTIVPVPGMGNRSCSATHTYALAGVYSPGVSVMDDDTGTATSAFLYAVVYDPSSGFVTGGGWLNSPAGAYVANPSLTGKANFGFVSKYSKNSTVPIGETEFHFSDLNFHSSSYDWLVITGAKAQYQGNGTINNAGNYGFKMTVLDGQVSGGGGTDKIRIRIWDKNNGNSIVYDNQAGALDSANPTVAFGGGSIVIH